MLGIKFYFDSKGELKAKKIMVTKSRNNPPFDVLDNTNPSYTVC